MRETYTMPFNETKTNISVGVLKIHLIYAHNKVII